MSLNKISGFSNDDEFKNDLKYIAWDNILSRDDISARLAFNLLFARVNTLLDKHTPNHKLSKKEMSLKIKPWINKNIQSVIRECDRLFQRYCNEIRLQYRKEKGLLINI